jgi:hypothetical protein
MTFDTVVDTLFGHGTQLAGLRPLRHSLPVTLSTAWSRSGAAAGLPGLAGPLRLGVCIAQERSGRRAHRRPSPVARPAGKLNQENFMAQQNQGQGQGNQASRQQGQDTGSSRQQSQDTGSRQSSQGGQGSQQQGNDQGRQDQQSRQHEQQGRQPQQGQDLGKSDKDRGNMGSQQGGSDSRRNS